MKPTLIDRGATKDTEARPAAATPQAPNSATASALPRPNRSAAVWIGAWWFALGLPTLIYPFGRDQGVFAYVGRRLFEGDRFLVDIWDVKSPLIYWTYGIIGQLGGSSQFAVRLADWLVAALTAYLVYALASHLRGEGHNRTGAAAATLYLLWYYLPNDYRVLANCEVYFMPFTILAALLLAHALNTGSDSARRRLFWAGFVLGVAPLFKTTAAVFLLPALATPFLRPGDARRRALEIGALLAGFALPLCFGWLYLYRTGALSDWLYLNTVYLPYYTALSHTGDALRPVKLALYCARALLSIYPALLFGAALCLFKFRTVTTGPRALVALFALTYTGAVVAQGKYLHYHFLPFLPFYAALIPAVAMTTLESFRTGAVTRLVIVAIGALSLNLAWLLPGRYGDLYGMTFNRDSYQNEYFTQLSQGNYPLSEIAALGAFLKDNANPSDRLFVWSFEPELYYFSGLAPASRFIFNTPLLAGDLAAPWKAELMLQLQSAPPAYIVVGSNDGLPLITGETYSSAERLIDVPGLIEFIDVNYEEAGAFGRFTVYKKRVYAGHFYQRTSQKK